tara:strand:- start:622 stop:1083 length:462 start_codon:yes stop_codon:yes gene_type:complete
MPPIFPSVPPAADDGLDFDAAITRQEQLCDALEALADSLPERIDTYAAMQLAGRIVPTLKRCQRLEERVIFPMILERAHAPVQMIDRLRTEHMEDEDQAIQLTAAIRAYAQYPHREDAGSLGYALRGLFQPLRRHTAFDRDILLPMYRRALLD